MNTLRSRAKAWMGAVVVGACATMAWADGELDTRFGSNGVARIAFPNSSLGYLHDAAVVNGSIEAAGYERTDDIYRCTNPFPNLLVVRLSLDGAVIGPAHSYAQQSVGCPAGLIVDSTNGDIYMIGTIQGSASASATVARFTESGSLVAVYSEAQSLQAGTRCNGTRLLLDSQNRLVAACMRWGEFGYRELAMRRFRTDSSQLTGGALGSPGLSRVGSTSLYFIRTGSAVAQDAGSGVYYVVGAACAVGGGSACLTASLGGVRAQYVIRLGTGGALDPNFGDGGVAMPLSAPEGYAWAVTIDSSGNVLMAGEYGGAGSYGGSGLGYLARISPSGMPDATFGSGGVVQGLSSAVIDVQTDQSNRVYALGARSELMRFSYNGQRDLNFALSSQVQALNGPGSAWQAMRFSDSTRSSLYLIGGAAACGGCGNAATTAVIAKVNLDSGFNGPGATVTSLSSANTTITSGQSVTFTATVTGTNPTGTVTFQDGTSALGGPVALTAGSASYSTSLLAVGSHEITAAYSGDSRNEASTSPAMAMTVNALPSGGTPGGGTPGGGGSFSWSALLEVLCLLTWRLLVALPRFAADRDRVR